MSAASTHGSSPEGGEGTSPVIAFFESSGIPWMAGTAGQVVGFPERDGYEAAVRSLYDEGFTMCSDLCGVDYLTHTGRTLPEAVALGRFEVVVNLLDLYDRRRVRIRVQVPEHDPSLPSLFAIYPGTEAMEREVFDLYGIVFNGHPDLTRILMPEDWEGHPLRKDYDIGSIPVRFKEAGVAAGELVHTGRGREPRLQEAARSASRPAAGLLGSLPVPLPGRKKAKNR